MTALLRVLLPEPLGPIRAWISPRLTVRSTPLRISFSPTFTCRPSTFSRISLMVLFSNFRLNSRLTPALMPARSAKLRLRRYSFTCSLSPCHTCLMAQDPLWTQASSLPVNLSQTSSRSPGLQGGEDLVQAQTLREAGPAHSRPVRRGWIAPGGPAAAGTSACPHRPWTALRLPRSGGWSRAGRCSARAGPIGSSNAARILPEG